MSAPDMVEPSQPKWAVTVVGLPEPPPNRKRARIEPTLAPSDSVDISASFHRARLLLLILARPGRVPGQGGKRAKEKKNSSARAALDREMRRAGENFITENHLPFALRFGVHRRHGAFDRYGYHEVAQRRGRRLSVGIKLVVEPHVRLTRFALPIGDHVQWRSGGSRLRLHLVLSQRNKRALTVH